MNGGTRSFAGWAAVALSLTLLHVCTGEAAPPPADTGAPPEATPVTSEPEAGRTNFLWDPETGDAEALFTAPARQGADAELSPDGSRLVYERQVLAGPTQIYVLEADGTERPLTDPAWNAYDPTWSPDGKTIAFAGSKVEGSDLDIYTMQLAGGPPRRIAGTRKDDQHPDWSPDGTRIVFDARSGDPRSGRGEILVTSVHTQELHRLTAQHTLYAATAPAWSPDGRWIAYREYHQKMTGNDWPYYAEVKLMRPDGSHVRTVDVPGGKKRARPLQEPSWSPDGRSIVVERSNLRETRSVVLLVDPTTGEAHRITEPTRGLTEPSWGTGGILLTLWDDDPVPSDPAPRAFRLADLGAGMYVVNVRTGQASRFPEALRSIEGAGNYEVSPDGSMILFDNARRTTASDEPIRRGHHQLYVANIDGSDLRQLTDDPIGASQGSWSPDGTKIVYLGGWARLCCWHSPADLKILDLSTGTTTTVATGRARAFYDPFFSPDGETIMFTRYHYEDPSDQYDLWSIPVGGGRPMLVLEDVGYDASLSPDGTAILYRSTTFIDDGRCGSYYGVGWIGDADGNHPRLLVPGARGAEEALRGSSAAAGWSPDGSRIAYDADLAPPDDCHLDSGRGAYVMDVETGVRTLIAYGEVIEVIEWLDDRTLLIRARRGGEA